jgi:hypothetical protein
LRKSLVTITLAVVLGFALLLTAGIAVADPDLTFFGAPHRHFIQTPSGDKVEVGPDLCADPTDPATLAAFAQFHANTHTHNATTGAIGPVAPGLHDLQGADLTFGPC